MTELDEHEAYQVMSCFLERWFGEVADVELWPAWASEVQLDAEGDPLEASAWPLWLECLRSVRAGMTPGSPLERAPHALVAMNERLQAEGFLVNQRGSEEKAIGSGRIDWRRESVEIRAMRDVLDWQVWIRVAGSDWFHPRVWHALFTGSLPTEPVVTNIDEKCRLTLANLDDYQSAALQDPLQLRARLAALREQHFQMAAAYWKELRTRGEKDIPRNL